MPGSHNQLLNRPAAGPRLWALDPRVVYMNHGAFGSCPRPVLDYQRKIRDRLERQPIQFFVRDLEELLDDARGALAKFLGADPEGLVFVPNATAGVNTVLRSLRFKRGDELLVTDHEYNACRNALNFIAGQSSRPGKPGMGGVVKYGQYICHDSGTDEQHCFYLCDGCQIP